MKKILTISVMLCMATALSAENKQSMFNPIHTALVSQTIAPDARAGGMGDVGAATDRYEHSLSLGILSYRRLLGSVGIVTLLLIG